MVILQQVAQFILLGIGIHLIKDALRGYINGDEGEINGSK